MLPITKDPIWKRFCRIKDTTKFLEKECQGCFWQNLLSKGYRRVWFPSLLLIMANDTLITDMKDIDRTTAVLIQSDLKIFFSII